MAAFARPHLCENGCRPMSKNQRVHHLGSDGRFGRTKRRLSRHLKYMACARIFEFESHHPGTQSVSWGASQVAACTLAAGDTPAAVRTRWTTFTRSG